MARCNLCAQRNVKSAYHTICEKCTTSTTAKMNLIEWKLKEVTLGAAEADEEGTSDQHDELNPSPNAEQPTSSIESIHRVCAMCAKEAALPDEDQPCETVDEILAKESRRVSLRERKSMERKLEKDNIDQKKIAKAERRRLRNEGDENWEADNGGGNGSFHDFGLDDGIAEDELEVEDDPFLKAVGGADKLLIGDAYREMLMSREKGLQHE